MAQILRNTGCTPAKTPVICVRFSGYYSIPIFFKASSAELFVAGASSGR